MKSKNSLFLLLSTVALSSHAEDPKGTTKPTPVDASTLMQNLVDQNETTRKQRIQAIHALEMGLATKQNQTAAKVKTVETVTSKVTADLLGIQREVEGELFYLDVQRATVERLHLEAVDKLNRTFRAANKTVNGDLADVKKENLDEWHKNRRDLDLKHREQVEKCDALQSYVLDGLTARVTTVLDSKNAELAGLNTQLLSEAKNLGSENQILAEGFEKALGEARAKESGNFGDAKANLIANRSNAAGAAGTASINEFKSWQRKFTPDQEKTFIQVVRAKNLYVGQDPNRVRLGPVDLNMLNNEIPELLSKKNPLPCRLFKFDEEVKLVHGGQFLSGDFEWLRNGTWSPLPEVGRKKLSDLMILAVVYALQNPPREDLKKYNGIDNYLTYRTIDKSEIPPSKMARVEIKAVQFLSNVREGNYEALRQSKEEVSVNDNGSFVIEGVTLIPVFETVIENKRLEWSATTMSEGDETLRNRWYKQMRALYFDGQIPPKVMERYRELLSAGA